jgi:hypothetical protein
VPVQRFEHRSGEHTQVPFDRSLDTSGWTPAALELLMKLSASAAFEEAILLLNDFGLLAPISRAGLERLARPYAKACCAEVREQLESVAFTPLDAGSGRRWVLEVDGVRVLGRASQGQCEGIEIKTAVLYPYFQPTERRRLAEVCEASNYTPLTAGLLRTAGVRADDELIGVSDGALWIEALYERLGARQVIDVYHACDYLEKVMVALGWEEADRTLERRRFCRGELNVGAWLELHLPEPGVWLQWPSEAQGALHYLEERKDRMAYADYRARDWPIGSGQIEGMNKSVIGKRMKQSGMQWSREGASRMAALRAQRCSKWPISDHDTLRRKAFPVPAV